MRPTGRPEAFTQFLFFAFFASFAVKKLGLAWVKFIASQGEDLRMGGGTGKQKKV